ncbi:hypothetical protein U9M48_041923 [Paspalum notatum var. saurae]|uniref:PWWP domain-containing protein n=1 Tax=Paspalum notatum var. saurae TaxID=547442 RepID=A0AAQ3XFF1_PASNO
MPLLPVHPKAPPRRPKPKPKPEPRSICSPKPRFSFPLHRMSDPAVGGALMPAGSAGMWANGGPRFGDMVWGKVKSHPWWPGHIYSINLTDDDEVHRGRRDGLILVAFFGDSSYGWFEPHELVPFEEHFAEKAAQGGSTRSSFAAAVAEAVDEVARRSALALLCPCRKPGTFRTHPSDSSFLLVDVPGFDSDADYHPDQIQAARQRFVPRKALDYLLDAAVTQRDAAEAAARTLPGIEMAGMIGAYRRTVFATRDDTYAEAFGVDPQRVIEAEKEAAAQRARARPLKGARRTPDQATATPGRRRGGAGGAAARLMEKIVPGASAMKAKASKKDQYLLKRRDAPEPAHRPPLPDAPPPAPAMDDGPPGFPPSEDPPTPPLPGSSIADEEFMLQRRAPVVELPPAAQGTEAAPATAAVAVTATDAAPKKAPKAKKPRKPEREEAAAASADADAAVAAGEIKKKKKKKKISNLDAAGGGSGKPAAFPDPSGLDLTQVISDIRNLPLAPFHGADRRISDASRSFILAFRSKHYKKSYENDPPEEAKKILPDKPNAAAAADGQPPKKKKPVAARPGLGNDPTRAGVKRGPSDRQEELAVKKKAKLEKIKTLSSEKKAAGLEQKESAVAAQQARSVGAKEKAETVATAGKKKEPAAPPTRKTPSPTALMMKFPVNSTLPSVASLKARFARFGALDVDGIRVYWKSHMCRVVYRFRSDAEAALRYARANAMFGQVDTQYHLRGVEGEPEAAAPAGRDREPPAAAPAPDAPPEAERELRLLETASFRPGSSGNGAPLATSSRAMPARPNVGPPPKSILKKTGDEASRAKFAGEGAGASKQQLEPPALAAGGGAAAAAVKPGAKSVGFPSPQQPLQPPSRTLAPPMRPAQPPLQPPRAATQQVQLPPPPPYLPPRVSDYPPHRTEGPLAFPGQPAPYAGHSTLPGPPPYLARSTSFTGQPYQPHRAGDIPPVAAPAGQAQQQQQQKGAGEEVPAWKTSKEEFEAEVWRLMTGIAKMVEPLTDKNGNFPYHLFSSQ